MHGSRVYEIRKFDKELTGKNIMQKGYAKTLADAVGNIPHPLFGEHNQCKDSGSWCKGEEQGSSYRHPLMTGGKNLSPPAFRKALVDIFTVYSTNAEKLCPGTNSQQSESFNSIVITKAPKTRQLWRLRVLRLPFWCSCLPGEHWLHRCP